MKIVFKTHGNFVDSNWRTSRHRKIIKKTEQSEVIKKLKILKAVDECLKITHAVQKKLRFGQWNDSQKDHFDHKNVSFYGVICTGNQKITFQNHTFSTEWISFVPHRGSFALKVASTSPGSVPNQKNHPILTRIWQHVANFV